MPLNNDIFEFIKNKGMVFRYGTETVATYESSLSRFDAINFLGGIKWTTRVNSQMPSVG